MGQGELEEIRGASKKYFNFEGGAPKTFLSDEGGPWKKKHLFLNLLFHQIILINEINILEYLVLIWTYLIKNLAYEIEVTWQVAQENDLSM